VSGSRSPTWARLERNPYGGIVVCGDRGLLAEEAPEAYKNIERVIDDLVEFGLARVVATFRPLVTFKKAQSNVATGGAKREKSWREDRR
jgi:release factor H-coupled RctB family protein